MTRHVKPCSVCRPQGWTKADCFECSGFGEYWTADGRWGEAPEALGRAGLSRASEAMIREMLLDGASLRQVARAFYVSAGTVAAIRDGGAAK